MLATRAMRAERRALASPISVDSAGQKSLQAPDMRSKPGRSLVLVLL